MVPLLIMNYDNEDIEIKRVYIDYEDKFLHFHKKSKSENRDKIFVKKNTHNQFSYIIFDGEYGLNKDSNKYVGKIQNGSTQLEYFYNIFC